MQKDVGGDNIIKLTRGRKNDLGNKEAMPDMTS